jgi:dimeric dUTPase (all-alpha-NTP-PPase superfamily)
VKIDTEQFERMHDFNESFEETDEFYTVWELLEKSVTSKVLTLHYVLALGHRLGFTWEEINNAYMAKNKVNYERLESGY